MTRPTTALLAALDALLAVAIGLGIPLVMLTVLWATQFDLSVDWTVFWRGAADLWMLGNGVDLLVTLDPATATRLALDQAGVPFEIGIAPLGFALLTAFLGRRSGLRLGFSGHPALGLIVGILVSGGLAALVWQASQSGVAVPSLRQAVLFVPAIYGLGVVLGAATSLAGSESPIVDAATELVHRIPRAARPLVALALRGGAMTAAAIVVVAALVVAVLLAVNYSTVISLYESLQGGADGGAALTLLQLSLLPNIVVWAASWLVGPGFALGTGSSISPLGTQVGLVPALPVFGALPHTAGIGLVALVVPVAVGFLAGALLRPRLAEVTRASAASVGRMLGVGFGMGVVAASILSLLALWSGGALGPGRLADVGADPGQVWVWSAVLFGVSSSVGLLANGVRLRAEVEEFAASGSSRVPAVERPGRASADDTV